MSALFLLSLHASTSAETPTPRVFTLNAAELALKKQQYQTDLADPAYVKLLADADKAMKLEPMSVLQKNMTAPSGDKHDYLSFGRYLWPDPTKPNGMPYINRDGVYNPDSDGPNTDKARMGRVISAVDTLSQAYYYSGDNRYADHAALLLRTWFLDPKTHMNPNLNYAQSTPGREVNDGYGIIDTVTLSTQLVDSIGLLAGAPAWTSDDQKSMVDWMGNYLDWLQTSDRGKDEQHATNNHGTWYDVQVASLALFCGRDDLAKTVVESAETTRIATQIEPDGSEPLELKRTRSFSYSVYDLSAFLHLAVLGDHVGVDLWDYQTADGRSIRKALDFLIPYSDPAKPWPYKQIESSDRKSLLPVLRAAYDHWRLPEYKADAQKLDSTD